MRHAIGRAPHVAAYAVAVAAPSALAQDYARDALDATVEHALAAEAASDAADALAAMRQDGEAQPAPIADPKLDDSVEKGELATGGVSLSLPTQGESVTVGKSVVSDTSLRATTLIAQAIPSGVRAMFTLADTSAPAPSSSGSGC